MITVSFLKNLNVKKFKSYFYKKSLLSLSREEYDICLLLFFFFFFEFRLQFGMTCWICFVAHVF